MCPASPCSEVRHSDQSICIHNTGWLDSHSTGRSDVHNRGVIREQFREVEADWNIVLSTFELNWDGSLQTDEVLACAV